MKFIKTIGEIKLNENYNISDLEDIMNQISEFIESNVRNKWIFNESLKIYIRNSRRYYKGSVLEFFDFASIEVYKEGSGFFTKLLQEFENRYPDKNIFIESVLTDRFSNYIENKLGFHRIDDQNNFYKIK